MPRPQQNNADYFSHDNNMRNHRKVKILRNKFGKQLGYTFWGIILEYLTGMDGTEFEYSDLEFEIIASEVGEVSAAEIKNMVDFALKIELLFKDEDGFIFSESLNDRLSPVFKKRNREREKSQTKKRRIDGKFIESKIEESAKSTTSGGVSAAEMRQSKVKESKVYNKKSIVVSDEPTIKPKTLHQMLCATWLIDTHPGWTFTAQNGKEIKSIGDKFKKILIAQNKAPTDQTISDAFKYMCINLPDWYKDKELSKINSGFNEIIEQIKNIKNGKTITGKQSQSKYAPTAQGS